jgi:hypothetical protein
LRLQALVEDQLDFRVSENLGFTVSVDFHGEGLLIPKMYPVGVSVI